MEFESIYISKLIDMRQMARDRKDFGFSDRIREYLDTQLTFVFDGKDGQEIYHHSEAYFANMEKIGRLRGIVFESKRKFVEWNIKEDIRLEKVVDAWVYSTLAS